MRRFAAPALLSSLVATLALSACPPSGPVSVEALVFDPAEEDGVRLDVVELSTMHDIGTGDGELFDVRGGLRMAALDVISVVGEETDPEEIVRRTRGDGGHTVQPAMSQDNGVYVAEDFDTLNYFTVFLNIEQVWLYARDVVGDDSGAVKDDALVGVNSEVVAANLLPFPVLTADNAAYAAPLDSWLTLRPLTQEGVPFSMSLPVIAHEFGHRLFHKNVFLSSPEAFNVWRGRLDENQTAESQRATRLLQGVDEGLADIYSIVMTGDREGVPRAFAQAKGVFADEAGRRDLEDDFATAATYDGLNELTLDDDFLKGCGVQSTAPLFEQESFNFYCLGTVLARTLWEGSDRDIETLRGEVYPAVHAALPELGDTLAAGELFTVEVLLDHIAQQLAPGTRRDAVCEAITARFASLVAAGGVPTCQ